MGLGGPPDAGALGGGTTDQLSNPDLASLNAAPDQMMTPEDQQAQQLGAALDDPNTPPQIKEQIMQELELAARRQMGQGFGGQGGF